MAVATSKAITSATTKIYIALAQTPATYDQAGFEALTWTEIGEISNLGTLGGQTTIVQHIPVGTAAVVKRAGSVNYGTIDMTGARCNDTGIAALRTAFASRLTTPFKVVYPAALDETDYFTGIVASNQTTVATADSILGFTGTVEIDNEVITGNTP